MTGIDIILQALRKQSVKILKFRRNRTKKMRPSYNPTTKLSAIASTDVTYDWSKNVTWTVSTEHRLELI